MILTEHGQETGSNLPQTPEAQWHHRLSPPPDSPLPHYHFMNLQWSTHEQYRSLYTGLTLDAQTGGILRTTSSIERTLRSLRSSGASVTDSRSIREYLNQNADVIDLLIPVYQRLIETLAPDTRISLQRYKDIDEGDDHLLFLVRQHEYQEGLIDLLRRIATEFQEDLADTRGWIVAITDFQTPGEDE